MIFGTQSFVPVPGVGVGDLWRRENLQFEAQRRETYHIASSFSGKSKMGVKVGSGS